MIQRLQDHDIASQWHPTKNAESDVTDFKTDSAHTAWWLGECGHEWQAKIRNRIQNNAGCTVCSGKQILAGFNDLFTTHPQLAVEWHPTKNTHLNPTTLSRGSQTEAYWVGVKCGHEWKAIIGNRALRNSGCPYCSGNKVLAGFNDIATTHPELMGSWSSSNVTDLTQVTAGSKTPLKWFCELGHEWEASPSNRLSKRGVSQCPVCSGKQVLSGFNDLASQFPEKATQYSPKNLIAVNQIHMQSNKLVLWVCDAGHEWKQTVNSRVRNSSSTCPVESNRILLPGFNDAVTKYPNITKHWSNKNSESLSSIIHTSRHLYEWECEQNHTWSNTISKQMENDVCFECETATHLTLNNLAVMHPLIAAEYSNTNSISANQMLTKAKNLVQWVGQCGHEWLATVYSRTQKGTGCPYCSSNKVLDGFNDLATKHPAIAEQWHPTENTYTPNEVTSRSSYLATWLCELGHTWQATVKNRTVGKTGCPYCSGSKVLAGFNDLGTTHPQLVAEWHPTRNEVTPSELTSGSGTPIWWACDKGHEWVVAPLQRAYYSTGCPTCQVNVYVSKGEQELADYLTHELSLTVEQSCRSFLKGQEIDMYIPDRNIAIEYNGLYWHREAIKGQAYHYDKWLACQEQGVQLIQIWEDEWLSNPEQVKNMLAYKLKASVLPKIGARNTTVRLVPKTVAEAFLNQHHIQGYASGSYYLALQDKGTEEYVAIMVLKKEPGTAGQTLNIIRYATSITVVGGFTKLLTHAEKTYTPQAFITFSDNCVSDGKLYEQHDFIVDEILPPDYKYIHRNARHHKFNYRLKRFRDDPNLLWEEGLTEAELAKLNNLSRIWDAGKIRWKKVL